MEEPVDALPRNDVDLETEMEGLRDFVLQSPKLINHAVWLDLEEFESRVEQLIGMLPKEVRRAKRITREEQRIIQDAKDEARRLLEESRAEADQIVRSAQEEADRLVESSAIRQRALEQAEATIAQSEQTARQVREQSFQYANQVIDSVITSLQRLGDTVQSDKAQLQQNRPDKPRA